jgi:hypothetical protein
VLRIDGGELFFTANAGDTPTVSASGKQNDINIAFIQ